MVADSIYRIQDRPLFTPNRGRNQEIVKTKDLLNLSAVVKEIHDGESPDSKMFPIVFDNIFQKYVFYGGKNDSGYSVRSITFDNKPFKLWQTQLNFAVWCATSALGISAQHLTNMKYPMVRSLYLFHTYYHIRRILHICSIKIPGETGFQRYANNFDEEGVKRVFAKYCRGTTYKLEDFRNEKNEKSYQPNARKSVYLEESSSMRWIIQSSGGLIGDGPQKLSESVGIFTYLVLSAQMGASASITGTQSKNEIARIRFKEYFENLVKREISVIEDIRSFNEILKISGARPNYNVGEGVYFMPSDMILKGGEPKSIKYKINKTTSDKTNRIGLNERVNYEIIGESEGDKSEREKEKEQEEEAEREERGTEGAGEVSEDDSDDETITTSDKSYESSGTDGSDDEDDHYHNSHSRSTSRYHPRKSVYKKIMTDVKTKKKKKSNLKIDHDEEKIAVILAITSVFAVIYAFKKRK